MGQGLSCGDRHETGFFFRGLQNGDVEVVRAMVEADPSILHHTTNHQRLTPLHVAAASGQIDVSSSLSSTDFSLFDFHVESCLLNFLEEFSSVFLDLDSFDALGPECESRYSQSA